MLLNYSVAEDSSESLGQQGVHGVSKSQIQLTLTHAGGPAVKTPRFHYSGEWVQSLVRELRLSMLDSAAKKFPHTKKSFIRKSYLQAPPLCYERNRRENFNLE